MIGAERERAIGLRNAAIILLLGALAACSSGGLTPHDGGNAGAAAGSGGGSGEAGAGGAATGGSTGQAGAGSGGADARDAGAGGALSDGSAGVGGTTTDGSAAAGASGGEGGAGRGGTGGGTAGRGGAGGGTAGRGGAGGGTAGRGGAGGGTAGRGGAGGGDPNEIDVYLIAGQSNATGQGYTKNIPSSFVVDTAVQLYHSADIISGAAANTWIPLRHASEAPDSGGDRFGPELGFGSGIHGLFSARRIGLIKHAKSATNLVQQWAPGSNAADTTHFGPEFKTFVATVDGGLKALRDQGLHPVIRGMLWQQGEADADLGSTASQQYGQNLSALIARVREQWATPSMLFIYGYVYPRSNYGTGRDQVRQGEANVDQDSGNALAVTRAFVVVTDDLELRANDPGTPYPSDLIHFGTAGQLELGKRMAAKVFDKM